MQPPRIPPRYLKPPPPRQLFAGLALLWWLAPAAAVDVSIAVRDDHGAAPDEVIVALYARPANGAAAPSSQHKMDQVDKQFVPRLLAIRVGDEVSFPNSDNIRHHVYSFSPARPFELPLYRGIPSAPIKFDAAGKVVLGCNIHDRMAAHIYVLDTPWYATVTGGLYTFTGIAPGDYEVALFHPRQAEGEDGKRHLLTVSTQATQQLELNVALQAAPASDKRALSPLERKFEALRRDTQ